MAEPQYHPEFDLIDTTGLPLDYGYMPPDTAHCRDMKDTFAFKSCRAIVVVMDKFYLDPIIGMFFPGVTDLATQIMALPFIYVSLFKIKSIPLSLAILYNSLMDAAIGVVPVLGDILDFFSRSHKRNYNLLVGYIDGDPATVKAVHTGAVKCSIMIVVFTIIIAVGLTLLSHLATTLWAHFGPTLTNFFHNIF